MTKFTLFECNFFSLNFGQIHSQGSKIQFFGYKPMKSWTKIFQILRGDRAQKNRPIDVGFVRTGLRGAELELFKDLKKFQKF